MNFGVSKKTVGLACILLLFLWLYNTLLGANESFEPGELQLIHEEPQDSSFAEGKTTQEPSPQTSASSSISLNVAQPSHSPVMEEEIVLKISPSPAARAEIIPILISPSSSISPTPHANKLPQQHPQPHANHSPTKSSSPGHNFTFPSPFSHPSFPPIPQTEFAYATIVNGPNWQNYFIDTLTLQYSLKYIANVSYPLIVIVEPSMHPSVKDAFRSAGMIVKELPPYPIPRTVHPRSGHWRYSFAKIYLWNMTEYKQIIHLDSDVIVVRSLDHLFGDEVKGGFIGPPCWTACEQESIVCGAFFKLSPNINTAQLLNHTLWTANSSNSFGGGDLDLFQMVFKPDSMEEHLRMQIVDKNYLVWQMLCSCETPVFSNSVGIGYAATQWWELPDRSCVNVLERGTNAGCMTYFWCRKKEYKRQAKLLWWNYELFIDQPHS